MSVLGQEFDPSLVKRQCMAKEADMFHPVDRPREHLVAYNPDGRDSIPKSLIVSVQGSIKAEYILHTRHQRNALVHLCMRRPA